MQVLSQRLQLSLATVHMIAVALSSLNCKALYFLANNDSSKKKKNESNKKKCLSVVCGLTA